MLSEYPWSSMGHSLLRQNCSLYFTRWIFNVNELIIDMWIYHHISQWQCTGVDGKIGIMFTWLMQNADHVKAIIRLVEATTDTLLWHCQSHQQTSLGLVGITHLNQFKSSFVICWCSGQGQWPFNQFFYQNRLKLRHCPPPESKKCGAPIRDLK